MTSNVIPMPKRKEREHSEDRLIIITKKDGWVDFALAEVYFLDDKPFGYAPQPTTLMSLEPIRARQVDDPEVIREVIKNKLKVLEHQLDAALLAVAKPIVTLNEEDTDV